LPCDERIYKGKGGRAPYKSVARWHILADSDL